MEGPLYNISKTFTLLKATSIKLACMQDYINTYLVLHLLSTSWDTVRNIRLAKKFFNKKLIKCAFQ